MHIAHLAELLEIQIERLNVWFKAQRGHGPQQVVPVDGLALLLLALVAGPVHPAQSELQPAFSCWKNAPAWAHSLVMKLINSETHSCTVSLASLAILALLGSCFFCVGRRQSASPFGRWRTS